MISFVRHITYNCKASAIQCFILQCKQITKKSKASMKPIKESMASMFIFYVWCSNGCLIMTIILATHAQKCTSLAFLCRYCGNSKTMLPLNYINKNGINGHAI
jgi:hypothetical protein